MNFSVLVSVYGNEKAAFLDESLDSIWDSQTLKPAQIVLVKDGPLTAALDHSIDAWRERLGDILTLVPIEVNVGLAAALNVGLQHCKYELVVRMDTDDVALPERFERQVKFMAENENVAASSAVLEEWDPEMKQCLGKRSLPEAPEELHKFAKRRSPLNHPLVIFRKSAVLDVGGYPDLPKAQDYGLWALLIQRGYSLANLPDVLLRMRAGDGLFERRGLGYFRGEIILLRYQRSIGFLSRFDVWLNLSARFFLRLSPRHLKSFAYRSARG